VSRHFMTHLSQHRSIRVDVICRIYASLYLLLSCLLPPMSLLLCSRRRLRGFSLRSKREVPTTSITGDDLRCKLLPLTPHFTHFVQPMLTLLDGNLPFLW
jgi:hypothetical protein